MEVLSALKDVTFHSHNIFFVQPFPLKLACKT